MRAMGSERSIIPAEQGEQREKQTQRGMDSDEQKRSADNDACTTRWTISLSALCVSLVQRSGAVDHLRYIHLDIPGGSNNIGSATKGGSHCASGGKGGTTAARTRHTLAQQATQPTDANRRDPRHRLCNNCSPNNKNFASNYCSTTSQLATQALSTNDQRRKALHRWSHGDRDETLHAHSFR